MSFRTLLCVALVACNGTDGSDDTDTDTDAGAVDAPFADHPLIAQRILNVAHRGGALIAPEETTVAFDAAIEAGADVLEIDVWSTEDGVLVLLHDGTLERTTDGTGTIGALTWAEASALDAGYWYTEDEGATYPHRGQGVGIARLDDVLAAYPEMLFSIEIKQQSPSIVEPVLAAIDTAGVHDQVVVGAFDDAVLQEVRAADPTILTTLGTTEAFQLYSLTPDQEGDYTPSSPFFAAPLEYGPLVLTEADVAKAHRLGITIHMWTINDPADMDLVLGWDVDGVITDDPITLQAKLDARSAPPARAPGADR